MYKKLDNTVSQMSEKNNAFCELVLLLQSDHFLQNQVHLYGKKMISVITKHDQPFYHPVQNENEL